MIEFELAGIDIEPDHGTRIEVIARAGAARFVIEARPIVERRRIAGTPPDRVAGGVEGARHPTATAAGAPVLVPPGLQRVLRAADGQKLPFLLTGSGVDAEDRPAIGPLAP